MSWMYALCCSCVFESMQNRHVSCRPDQEERGEWEHISVAGCPSRRRDRLTSSLCRGLVQLPEEPQRSRHSCRRDHVFQPHTGGCPANPDCPRQSATGHHSAQSHVPPLARPDGVEGWRFVDHLVVTCTSFLFPDCFTDSNSKNR